MSKVVSPAPAAGAPGSPAPLCFRLEDLVRSNLSIERRLAALRGVALSAATLPYSESALARVAAARDSGRPVALVPGGDRELSAQVARHLDLELIEAPVQELERRLGAPVEVARPGRDPGPGLRDVVRALRLHQWLKNLLLFVPLLTSHRILETDLLLRTALGVLAFGLIASSVYLANDLLDLDADRRHPRKRKRPFASGQLPLAAGLAGAPLLVAAGFALAMSLSQPFALVLGGYLIVTTAYTLHLKRLVLVDVLCLAGLYVLRIFAGAAVTGIAVSNWLLAFSAFAFLSLALVKRASELRAVDLASGEALRGRGYLATDLSIVSQIGVSAGQLAVVVLALYAHSDEVARLYAHPMRLWAVCAVVFFWLSRVWILAARGQMHDDPVVFAARDRTSYALFGVTLLLLLWSHG